MYFFHRNVGKITAPQIFWLFRPKVICDRQCCIGKPTDPIITVIITCARYKVPIGIIRAPKLVARPSVANRETRSDSLSIDRSLHSVCGRSFRDRCNCAYTSVLIGGSCTARFSATDDCMKSRHGANLLRATSVRAIIRQLEAARQSP